MSLLARANRRYFLRHPLQLLLAVIGVALGVAMVVSIDLATESTHRAFSLSMQAITGRYTHQITGGQTGIEESLYTKLRVEQGLHDSAPAIDSFVRAREHTLRLVGFDAFAERGAGARFLEAARGDDTNRLLTDPNTVLLSAVSARELVVAPGDELELSIAGRLQKVRVLGFVEGTGAPDAALQGLMLADIATAQELLGRVGLLDRIDLMLPDHPEAVAHIRRLLPQGVQLESTGGRNSATQNMTAAFELNLKAMSLLALLVGAFLIYNTMAFSVLQRRELLASLRILGATRRQLLREVLVEAGLLGLAGGLVGLAFGVLAARALLHLVTQTINDLYFVLTVTEFMLDPLVLLRGLALGITVAVLAALGPAREAACSSPWTTRVRSGVESGTRKRLPGLAGVGALCLFTAGILLQSDHIDLVPAIVGVFMILLGFGLMAPWQMMGMAMGIIRLARMNNAWLLRLAVRGVAASVSRTGVAIAALTIAVAVSVGVGIMIDSFRGAITEWLGQILQADIYVATPGNDSRADPSLPENLERRMASVPGVDRTGTGRSLTVGTSVGESDLLALRPPYLDRPGFRFKYGDGETLWRSFPDMDAVLISEPYAQKHGLHIGDRIELHTDTGPVTLPVTGVFFDYRSDQGLIVMHRALYNRYWKDRRDTSLGLYLEPKADLHAVRRQVERIAEEAGQPLIVRSNREIRAASLEVFERTFAITQVLRLLAVGVAFVGILSALMAFQYERRRELAVLRATGLTPGQTGCLMLLQTGFMGLVAGLLSIPLGLAVALALVRVIHLRSFGWTMDLSVSPSSLVYAVVLSLLAALLAGMYPAWQIMKVQPAAALREE